MFKSASHVKNGSLRQLHGNGVNRIMELLVATLLVGFRWVNEAPASGPINGPKTGPNFIRTEQCVLLNVARFWGRVVVPQSGPHCGHNCSPMQREIHEEWSSVGAIGKAKGCMTSERLLCQARRVIPILTRGASGRSEIEKGGRSNDVRHRNENLSFSRESMCLARSIAQFRSAMGIVI